MGMMARMRGLASWFIIGVGGLFVLFMVISDSKVTDITRQQSFEIGSINGKPITQQQFNQMVENYKQNQEAQTGQAIPETQMEQFRDQVWNGIVSQYLVEEKIKEYGIVVTDDEIKDAIIGDNPPAFLQEGFKDSLGNFNRDAYLNAIYDPNNKKILVQVEEQIRQQKIQEKLQSYIGASVLVTDDEVKRDFIDENTKMTAVYAAFDARSIADSTIKISDNEIKDYYNNNKEDYVVPEKRSLKYIIFSNAPTETDSNNIKKQIMSIIEKIKSDSSSFKTYAEIYSSQPYSIDTVEIGKISIPLQDALVAANDGDLVGPILINSGWGLIKLNKRINAKDTFVKVSHILIGST
jgi:hypothetical protein